MKIRDLTGSMINLDNFFDLRIMKGTPLYECSEILGIDEDIMDHFMETNKVVLLQRIRHVLEEATSEKGFLEVLDTKRRRPEDGIAAFTIYEKKTQFDKFRIDVGSSFLLYLGEKSRYVGKVGLDKVVAKIETFKEPSW